MSYRQLILTADSSIQRLRVIGKWIAILTIAIPMGLVAREFWDHGLFVAAFMAMKSVVLSLWNMLCDFAAVCVRFFQFVFHLRT